MGRRGPSKTTMSVSAAGSSSSRGIDWAFSGATLIIFAPFMQFVTGGLGRAPSSARPATGPRRSTERWRRREPGTRGEWVGRARRPRPARAGELAESARLLACLLPRYREDQGHAVVPGPQAVVLALAGRAIQRPPDCRALHEFDAREMLSFRGAGIVVILLVRDGLARCRRSGRYVLANCSCGSA